MKSKKASLLVLAITAITFSKILLLSFADPEGPNMLVIFVTAAAVYILSLVAYAFGSFVSFRKKFWLAVLLQIVFVAILYFLLK